MADCRSSFAKANGRSRGQSNVHGSGSCTADAFATGTTSTLSAWVLTASAYWLRIVCVGSCFAAEFSSAARAAVGLLALPAPAAMAARPSDENARRCPRRLRGAPRQSGLPRLHAPQHAHCRNAPPGGPVCAARRRQSPKALSCGRGSRAACDGS